jgi:hypothetical protein
MHRKTFAAVALLLAGPAAAQETAWTFQGSLYGWLPGLSTTIGTPFGDYDVESSGSDALSNLDMTFMGTLEARTGKWGLIGDLLYVDLSDETGSPFDRRFEEATLETTTAAFSGYAVYRTYQSDSAIVDAGAGFRVFDLGLDLGLRSADSRPDYDASESETWAVPLVAVRLILPLTESWFATAFADGGLTSSDTSTWQVFGSVGYRFNERWSTQLGWRYMDIEKELGGLEQPGRRWSMRRISGMSHRKGAASAAVLSLALLGSQTGPARADEAQARGLLAAMTEYLAVQQALSFDLDSTTEVVTTDGAKVAIASSGSLVMERPDKIRLRRDGGFATVEMTFDGKQLSVANSDAKVYAQSEVPGTVGDLIDTLREVYGLPLPAADLLASDAGAVLLADVTEVRDLGSGVIRGDCSDPR